MNRSSRSPRRPAHRSRNARSCRPQLEALETRLAPATRIWSAGSVLSTSGYDPHWSNSQNWQGTVVPQRGDDIVFPALTGKAATVGFANTDDLTGLNNSFRSVEFQATGYVLDGSGATGNILQITGSSTSAVANSGIVIDSTTTGGVTFNATLPIALEGTGNTPNFQAASNQTLTFLGTVGDGSDPTAGLVVNFGSAGEGTVVLAGNNGFSNALTVYGGILTLATGTAPGARNNVVTVGAGNRDGLLAIAGNANGVNFIDYGLHILSSSRGLRNGGGNDIWGDTGNVVFTFDNTTVNVDAGSQLTLNGTVVGINGLDVNNPAKTQPGEVATGRLVLGGTVDNGYLGQTRVNAGGLELDKPGALGSSPNNTVVVSAGASLLTKTGGGTIVPSVTLNGGTGRFPLPATLEVLDGGKDVTTTFSGGLTLGGLTSVQVDRAGDTAVQGGVVAGSGVLTKAGPGKLQLTGAVSNTNGNGGTTTVLNGELDLMKSGTAAALTGPITVGVPTADGSQAVVKLFGDSELPADVTVTLLPTGTVNLNGHPLSIGRLDMTGGTLDVSGGTATLDGDVTTHGTQTSATISDSAGTGTLVLANGTARTFTVARNPNTLYDLSLTATVAGAAGLTKAGPGVLRLAPAGGNTYAGNTAVNAGTLALSAFAGVAVPGGTAQNPQGLVVGNGTGPAGAAVVQLLRDGQTGASLNVTVNGDGLFNVFGHKDSVGALALSGGDVEIGLGTLTLTTGGVQAGGAALVRGTPPSGATPNLDLNGQTRLFTVAAGPGLVVSAAVGDGGVTKSGPGPLTFNQDNPYTGPTVINQGLLSVNGVQTASAVTVNAGATLGGSGKVGPTVVAAGGTIDPGNPGFVGTLGVGGDLTLGGTLGLDVFGASPGQFDVLAVTGAVNLTGATLAASPLPSVAVGVPMQFVRAGTVSGTFEHTLDMTTSPPADLTQRYAVTYSSLDVTLDRLRADATVATPTADQTDVSVGQLFSLFTTVAGSPGLPAPTGTVTFLDNGTAFAQAPVGADGSATAQVAIATAGAHAITATYDGDANYNPSVSPAALNLNVAKVTPLIKISVAKNFVPQSKPAVLIATLGEGQLAAGNPTGPVLFFVDGGYVGSDNLTAGKASVSVAGLPVGNHVVSAVYNGDQNFNKAQGTDPTPLVVIGDSPNYLYVNALYQALLNRGADFPGATGYVNQLDAGASAPLVVHEIESTAEYLGKLIDRMYVNILGRHADPGGVSAFSNYLTHGGSDEGVKAFLFGSDEYFQLQGRDNGQFIAGLFLNPESLGRPVDPATQIAYEDALAHGLTRSQAATSLFFNPSKEYFTRVVNRAYVTFLGRPADAGAQAYVNLLQAGKIHDEDVLAALLGSAEFRNANSTPPP